MSAFGFNPSATLHVFGAVQDHPAFRTDEVGEARAFATIGVMGMVVSHEVSSQRSTARARTGRGYRKSSCIDANSAAPGHSEE
jgi:hypothetical protein